MKEMILTDGNINQQEQRNLEIFKQMAREQDKDVSQVKVLDFHGN